MRVFVTGVKGQLGYDVMNELEKQGLEGIGVDIDEMDITDADQVNKVIKEAAPDAVIHCAALKAVGESVQKPLEYYRNNITGTLTLMDVIIQTWTLFSDIPRQCPVTGTDLKKLLHQFNGIFHSSGTGIRTIIF